MFIDLHMHSEHSMDGEFSVQDLVRMCKDKGIGTMAVTDHNTVSGVEDALRWGKKWGVEVIPAIEMDTLFAGKIFHLIGYFIDHRDEAYRALEESIMDLQMSAFPNLVEKLNRVGFELTWDAMLGRLKEGEPPTEELAANIIFENPVNQEKEITKPYLPGGARSSMPQFFFYQDFMAPGRECFTPRNFMSMEEAVKLVRRTGGVPIVAHPAGNMAGDYSLLDKLTGAGIAGFEAFSSYHTAEETLRVLRYSKENGLLFTCGSDFHGRMKREIFLGEHGCTEDQKSVYESLKAARSRKLVK